MSETPARELLRKALSRQSDPNKEELKDILHVAKQIFGVIFGIVAGQLQLTGIVTILGFVVVGYLFFYGYVFRFLQVDEQTIEAVEMYKQSFMLSFFSFMLAWTLSYTVKVHT